MKILGKERIERLLFQFFRWVPFRNKTVLFKSFGGQYNDNPKYISEMLHQMSPDTRIVWIISDKCKDVVPEYVTTIPYHGLKYYYYTGRSNVVVDNITGIRGGIEESYSKFFLWTMKSKHQLNIATWHGTPIKKIGLDTKELKEKKYYLTSADFMISGCKYTQEHLAKAFFPIPVINSGTPRNDLLVKKMSFENLYRLKSKLNLPYDKKIILFAPTFRNNVEYSGVKQMQEFDIKKIVSLFEHKFGGEWIFVFRVHHEVLKKIDTDTLVRNNPLYLFDGNEHDDMAEYLAVTDVLITDYSGSIFDFALTGKPCFLYTPDKEHYITDERGVYIPLEELPYPHSTEIDELYQLIEQYDEDVSHKRIQAFNLLIGNSEIGNAAEKITNIICDFIKCGRKENIL